MKELYQDLWQTKRGSHFGLDLKAYFLKTEEGNALIYYTTEKEELSRIQEMGGVKYQCLSHHHEVNEFLNISKRILGAELCCHRNCAPYLEGIAQADTLFDKDTSLPGGLRILETPGHTNSNVCYFYESPYGKNYLFSGDTIYLDKGEWNYLIMNQEGGNPADLKESLLKIKDLDVDVIMCSVAVGHNDAVEVSRGEWRQIIDRLVNKLGV
ncbi:MBL fold metallo-hydrolase [Fulvitalea axinellae]